MFDFDLFLVPLVCKRVKEFISIHPVQDSTGEGHFSPRLCFNDLKHVASSVFISPKIFD